MNKTKTLTQHFESFTYVDSDIKKGLFPLVDVPENTEYRLFHFNKYISSEDAIKEMEKEGYRAAIFSELLTWPICNEKDWVVALGSVGVVHGYRVVPFLRADGSRRDLDLYWWDVSWNSYFRFLGVRNSSLKTSDPLNPALDPLDALALERRIKSLERDMEKIKKFLII